MAPRANWKGYLRLSLVSCPIALYPASSLSEKVSFNRINRKTGNRLKQQNVDSETGEVVARDDMVRGYEVAKGQYMIVEDEEIDAVQIESTRTIDIDQFVPKSEIDERYIDSPYYIAPDGAGWSGGICRHSGHDRKVEHGCTGSGGAGAARARDRPRAEGARARRHDAALSLRGSGREAIFRGHPGAKAAEGDARPGDPHRRNEIWSLRSVPIRGSIRKRADRPVEEETGWRKDRTSSGDLPPPRVVNLMEALRASVDAEEKKAPAPSTRARRPAKKKASR